MENLSPVVSELSTSGQSPEILQANFENYRLLCDSYDSYRKVGCLDSEKYQELISDQSTIKLEINGQAYPLLASSKDMDGYDVTNCQKLTGKENIFLLAVPPSILTDPGSRIVLPENHNSGLTDAAIIIEDNASKSEEIKDLANKLSVLGALEHGEFVDPRVTNEDSQNATMELYSFRFSPSDDIANPTIRLNIYDGWKTYVQSQGASNFYPTNPEGVYLYSPEEVRGNEVLRDYLWDITSKGFGEMLGEFHPVSMEEDKEFFIEQITQDNAYTAVRYHEGNPACFSTVIDDVNSCSWLNLKSSSLSSLREDADRGELYYSSDIISDSDGPKGINFSFDVVKVLMHARLAMRAPTTLIFETSNLSSAYVPYLVSRVIGRDPDTKAIGPPSKISQMNYSYLYTRAEK